MSPNPQTPGSANIIQQFVENSTPLAANATFNGATQDGANAESGQAAGFSKFRAMAYSDQAGTLLIQQSRDGVTWRTTISQAVSAASGTVVESIICRQYVRCSYLNGATLQTVLELDSALVAV